MASFFISHSSRDNALAERVQQWLQGRGFTAVFLDFDPAVGIPAGRRWEDELYSELRKADVVLFLGTEAALDSKWCHAELVLARSLGRTIVPILLNGQATHSLIRDTQWIRVKLDGAADFEPLALALDRLAIDRLDTLEWDPRLPPYPGLDPFDEDRAGVFYGRDVEIATVLSRLSLRNTDPPERFVHVAGPSGSGKSSLIRAGVVPRLRRQDRPWVAVPAFRPGDRPLKRLAQAIAGALAAYDKAIDWPECDAHLNSSPDALADYVDDLLVAAGASDEGHVVLVVDQGEQLATLAARQERLALLDLLRHAFERAPQLRCLATLRSEYLTQFVEGSAFEGQALPIVTVGRLGPDQLAEVIERPAQRAGIVFDSVVVQQMVEEASRGTSEGGDPLPLLAFALRKLYDGRGDRTHITLDDYRAVGGVVAALKAAADQVYEQYARRGQADLVLTTLLELVHVEVDHAPSSRSVPRSRFSDERWEAIEAFVDARLLTTDGEEPVVHVAHDALLREWPLLSRAIDDFADELETRSRLSRDAREWQLADRDSSYLLSGRRLEAALGATSSTVWTPEPLIVEYVDASRRSASRRAWRRRLAIGLAAVVVLIVLGIAGSLAFDYAREAWRKGEARGELVRVGDLRVEGHEVSEAQFDLCVKEDRCRPPGDAGAGIQTGATRGTRAVVMIEAAQAISFCDWIGRRLPTAAEAVLAARSGELDHLLEGGREWTATNNGLAYKALVRDPDTGEVSLTDINSAFRDLDLTFRCVA